MAEKNTRIGPSTQDARIGMCPRCYRTCWHGEPSWFSGKGGQLSIAGSFCVAAALDETWIFVVVTAVVIIGMMCDDS